MAQTLTFQIDDRRFRRMLAKFIDLFQDDAAKVVETQTRLLLERVMRFTPPKSLKQGRDAVHRDIGRSMTPIDLLSFPDLKMRQRVNELANRKDKQGLQAIFDNSDGWRAWRVVDFDPSLHIGARDKRGRVRRSQRTFIPEVGAVGSKGRRKGRFFSLDRGSRWNKYVTTVQGHVGRLRSAWRPAMDAVKAKVPKWITRHSVPRGTVNNRIYVRNNPNITFSNFAAGVSQLIHPFQGAMKTRAEAMFRDIRRRLRESGRKAKLAA